MRSASTRSNASAPAWPLRATVSARPILIVPPQINKFYVYDLTAEKSIVRFLLERGFQVFMVSWRNPTAEQREWGLEDYVGAIERALAATSAISVSREVHTVGACAGGITLAAALGHGGEGRPRLHRFAHPDGERPRRPA